MALVVGEQCTALNVSDEKRCEETATSINGLFCTFHSRQCQGLYRGYKRRNAELDRLTASPPQYLAESKIPLTNILFADVDTEEVCQEIHEHLFRKFQLLERVIRARKLHHSRFFSMNYDYGHAKFLDQLQNERAIVTKALERIERRTAEILYKKQKWFKWVRQCQDEGEAHREKEQKRIRQEAALLRRHWKEVQQRLKEKRAREDLKKQNAFLERVYKERLAQQEEDEEDDSDWDPIEDVLEDNRGRFIDLIKHFLWMVVSEDFAGGQPNGVASEVKDVGDNKVVDDKTISECSSSNENKSSVLIGTQITEETEVSNPNRDTASASSKRSKTSKRKKNKTSTNDHTSPDPERSNANIASAWNRDQSLALSTDSKAPQDKKKAADQTPQPHPLLDKDLIETREEMYDRLKNGQEYHLDEIVGVMVGGTVENPVIATKTRPFPDDEIENLLAEISEIKYLLFCRLLLGHAALLPIALRANSVNDFLNDPEVTEPALRDLCLKMERPGLQEIRDACADLFRREDEENSRMGDDEGDEGDADDDAADPDFDMMILKPSKPKGALPEKWMSKREKAREKAREKLGDMPTREEMLGLNGDGQSGTIVDFGEIRDDGKFHQKLVRVKICGRTIWNYPSNNAMTRKGWLHFCIIAKDSSLYDAIQLCRHWDEFFELNILAIWHYFPGANWAGWVGNRWRQQMLQLGFIMYFESADPDASALSQRHQSARHGQFRRSHAVLEARNFICAHIKRNDPISRRFIQYLSMQSYRLLVLVRDAESGRLLIKPPEEERWLLREKSGLGRASKGQWNILKAIGPQFFEEMDRYKKWNFRFKEFYDVYVWDLGVGNTFPVLYNAVQEILIKAHRCCVGADLYNPAAPFLKTLTKDPQTHRVRDMRPEDKVESIYDEIHHENTKFFYGELETLEALSLSKRNIEAGTLPRNLLYNEADALEDEILFPEENSADGLPSASGLVGPLKRWEEEGFSIRKFAEGWYSESDYDSDSDLDSEDTEGDEDSENEEEDEVSENDNEGEEEDGKADEINEKSDGRENNGDESSSDQLLDKAHDALPPSTAFFDELQEMLGKLASRHVERKTEKEAMAEEFRSFLDREKARTFKEVWHRADMEPQAQTRYLEMKKMTKKSRKFNHRDLTDPTLLFTLSLIHWLEAAPGDDSKDVYKAVAKLSPFFYPQFLDSEEGQEFKESLLFNQEARAKNVPDIRSSVSNARRPKGFWREWDQAKKNMKDLDEAPAEWDVAIRPIIARLYKAGVIRNRADNFYTGQAVAAKEAHRDNWDLFFDWRSTQRDITLPPVMQDPFSIPDFRTTARKFSNQHPDARFAILRLWSAPHFYPLMIGLDKDKQDFTSFQDLTGRTFVWMFVPKDMPHSEWSMHHTARQRTDPFKKILTDTVVVKRNAFLVMGVDETDLMKRAMATAYAIERKPWRWEIDLWKSFVNVDFKFLDGLQDEWLE